MRELAKVSWQPQRKPLVSIRLKNEKDDDDDEDQSRDHQYSFYPRLVRSSVFVLAYSVNDYDAT